MCASHERPRDTEGDEHVYCDVLPPTNAGNNESKPGASNGNDAVKGENSTKAFKYIVLGINVVLILALVGLSVYLIRMQKNEGCSPFPTTIRNGNVFGSGMATGSTVIYRCDAGYLLWGNATMTCGPGGWDGDKPQCLEYLVHGPSGVPNCRLSASSVWDSHLNGSASYFSPMYARLNTQHNGIDGTGAWSSLVNDANQFIQVEFANTKQMVAVLLQGRDNPSKASWVTSFKVAMGTSCGGGGNINQFTVVTDSSGAEKIFEGNSDQDTVVLRVLPEPTMAKCLRILPFTWSGRISLRFDVLGI